MTRKSRKRLIAIIVLLLLLALLGAWYANFRATRSLLAGLAPVGAEIIPPTYLYSFSGDPEGEHLAQPIGVLVVDDVVHVTDGQQSRVFRFSIDGQLLGTYGLENLQTPLFMAQNPLDGNIYVSDRRTRKMEIFTPEGEWIRTFEPNLPEEERPDFTELAEWAPVAFDFGEDGSLYVVEILKGHRVLKFDPDGKFVKSAGTAALAARADQGELAFQFPNDVTVHNNEVWVTDSNNRRIQVLDEDLEFIEFFVTQGLPRGAEFTSRFRSFETTATPLITVDTLGHDGSMWEEDRAERIANFGQQGILEGQFLYPTSLDIGPNNLIFITDTQNARVQVWGWPSELSPLPPLPPIQKWGWCLTPLLLLPLLLLRRKKRFMVTTDFVHEMLANEEFHVMPHRRRRWIAVPEDYELLKDLAQDEVRMEDLLEAVDFSESDAQSLVERLEIEYEVAKRLALAQRAHFVCTEDVEFRRLSKLLELDVMNRVEFLDRFTKREGRENRPEAV